MSSWSDVLDFADAPGSAESLRRAITLNKWSNPFSSDKNSFDQFAGGFSADDSGARTAGRAVGSYFAGGALGDVAGGAGDAAPVAGDSAAVDSAGVSATNDAIAGVDSGTSTIAGAPSSADAISGPAATPATAATPAPTSGQASAQNLISGAQPNATPAQGLINTAQDSATGFQGTVPADASSPAALQPGQSVDSGTGSVVTPGAGTGAAEQPGIIDRTLNAIKAHPTASKVGAGAALGMYTTEMKRKADLEALAAKHGYEIDLASLPARQKTGNASVGGGGVNLNIRPGAKTLTRPGGAPVFNTGTGIINRNAGLNGVRG